MKPLAWSWKMHLLFLEHNPHLNTRLRINPLVHRYTGRRRV